MVKIFNLLERYPGLIGMLNIYYITDQEAEEHTGTTNTVETYQGRSDIIQSYILPRTVNILHNLVNTHIPNYKPTASLL